MSEPPSVQRNGIYFDPKKAGSGLYWSDEAAELTAPVKSVSYRSGMNAVLRGILRRQRFRTGIIIKEDQLFKRRIKSLRVTQTQKKKSAGNNGWQSTRTTEITTHEFPTVNP